ncbi:para-nitrobenzyl esterase [Povalibacter uvarum]|uniref:Carboxylic ester hydrolase n=2 Tax=Povalibacter uvarum TaxID=732238 RepID=A0A841HHR8_9GAMM|nr:carboxylesterase/lipase family protein [Povalibacter uvarum]MBB6092527.1 para-nitrobenzyl esterase [Povalibacter uvarum]
MSSTRVTRRDVLRGVSAGALAAFSSFAFAATRYATATTRSGKVHGSVEQGVHVFKGIPYGADTSSRRFRPALAPVAWKRARDALEYGPACPQPGLAEPMSEDCLVLNVWTPALRDGAKRAVMVYFHGGEFSSGSGSSAIYDGTRLCHRGDVVVVTVNHRLNAFGHLYLGRLRGAEYEASGNVGLLDLVQALTWVRDHAAEFGGNPDCVMVFGQSGGGAKIATLMAMPAARGLFHRAATMSGQQITAAGPRSSTLRASAYLDALKIPAADLARIDTIAIADLVAATRAPDATMIGRALYFGPVLDQVSLPRHPFYPDAPPQSAQIPMIIGNTRDETRAFLGNEPGIQQLRWEELPQRLLPHLHVDISPEYVVAEYRRLYPQYTATEVFFAATTAGRSWRGAVIEAELRAAQGSPVFAYQLNYRSPLDGGRYGAMHTMDIPLVFDNIAQAGSQTGASAEAQRTADQMSDAFIAFARTGSPNHSTLPQWRPYELDRRSTMVFDAQSQLVDDPRGAERKLFASVPYIQRGTY